MPVALLLSPVLSWPWRVVISLAAVYVAGPPVLGIAFSKGSWTLRRIEWSEAGGWRLTDFAGRAHPAELLPASAGFGRWLLLLWETPGPRRRLWALVDAAATEPRAFRALKGRLNC